MTRTRLKTQDFFTVEEAAAFYVEAGGHGMITHTIRGALQHCAPEAETDPAWRVEVFVPLTDEEIAISDRPRQSANLEDPDDPPDWKDLEDTFGLHG